MSENGLHTCCFFGHRKICETEELRERLCAVIEILILKRGVDTFLFGSKSRFNDLCHELVTVMKQSHPHIKRVYVRAEFPVIHDDYKAYLLESYEDTYYPAHILNAHKAVYVERNCEMIRNSAYCIVYYDAANVPDTRPSGTKIALDYATKQKKEVFLFP